MRINLHLLGRLIHYHGKFRIYRTIPGLLGMQSSTQDGNHVLFLDFDKTTKNKVSTTCRRLQHDWGLGNFYIFRSSRRNYHAVCLDKMTFGKCADIQISLGMWKYLYFAALRKKWIIRLSPKEDKQTEFIKCLQNGSHKKTSRAHYKMLNFFFPNIPKPNNMDNSKSLQHDIYTSVRK